MKNTTVFTSSMDSTLMKTLKEYSEKLKMPKNRIIEQALSKLFDELKKAEYARSFRKEKEDPEIIALAEEGLDDFLEILKRYE